ncbi:hypothetical protein [Deinococcus cellulosilyticus]|uniref:hypothetical protein n=1 Tax=Deinococcus cellulosilyticus TaxID=401558 RepID=UPI0011BD9456|nr:hypothetical protein [Deinococcus cellulosilyticus]
MLQVVFILEILRDSGPIRAHFAQAPKAAKRAITKYQLSGEWRDVEGDRRLVSELWQEGRVTARVVKETVEYS